MNTFLSPAMAILGRLRFGAKFILLGVMFVIPLCLVLYFFQREINTGLAFVNLERQGVRYDRPVQKLLEDTLAHERLTARYYEMRDVSQSDIDDLDGRVRADIRAVDAVAALYHRSLKIGSAWDQWKT